MKKTNKKTNRRNMNVAERVIMHSGKVLGWSLEEVNAVLTKSGLKPVTESNWNFSEHYVAVFQAMPSLMLEVCHRPGTLGEVLRAVKAAAAEAVAEETPVTERSPEADSGVRKVA